MILGLHGRKASSVCQPTTATYSAASSYTTRASAQQKGASCVEKNTHTHTQNTKQNPIEYHLSGAQEEEVDGYDGKVSGGGAGSIETCRDTDLITSRKLPCYRLDAHILIDTCRGRQLLVVEQVLDVSAHTVVFMHACQDTDKACLYMYKALGRICILREIKFVWNYEKQAHPRRKQCEHP